MHSWEIRPLWALPPQLSPENPWRWKVYPPAPGPELGLLWYCSIHSESSWAILTYEAHYSKAHCRHSKFPVLSPIPPASFLDLNLTWVSVLRTFIMLLRWWRHIPCSWMTLASLGKENFHSSKISRKSKLTPLCKCLAASDIWMRTRGKKKSLLMCISS
jgi:hypothetical protein